MTHLYRTSLTRPLYRKARVLVLCSLLAVLIIRPATAVAWAQSPGVIQLDLKEVSLKIALREIERQTPYHFVMNESRLRRVTKPVSLSIRTERIEDVLDQLLAGTNISYTIRKKQITLIPPEGESHTGLLSIDGNTAMVTQGNGRFMYDIVAHVDISVSGTVNDETGSALPGVSVVIKGSTQGTVTDIQGKFTLSVPTQESVLVFSFIGYVTQEVPVGSQTTFAITMAPDAQTLSEVVVVGYGTQEKKDVTGAISSVKGEELANLPVSGVQQSLQGRTSGVTIVRGGGEPGNNGEIRIRGVGTVNDASPLIVIDGVPASSLSDVNPNDIESMEILKDASASAIYGTQAANGVVIITTKRGRFGQGLKINVSGYGGISNRIKTIDVLDAPTLAMLKRERYTNDGLAINSVWEDPQYQTQKTDWQKELLGQGTVNNLDISISGGNDKSNYSLSAGTYDEKGMIKSYYFKRYSMRLNSDHKLSKRLSVGQNLQITNQKGSSPIDASTYSASAQDGLLWSAVRFHPGLPVKNADGTYSSTQISTEFGDINNPIFTVDTQDRGITHTRILASAHGDLEIVKGLHAKANVAVDANFDESRDFNILVLNQTRTTSRNALTVINRTTYNILQEYFLSYDKKFGNHALTLLAGYSQQTFNKRQALAQRKDFPSEDPSQRYLDAGQTITDAQGYRTYDALQSYFGRVTYSLSDKYLATITFRGDASSRFGLSNQRAFFPAFSLGWRVSEEPFFAGLTGIVPSLKLTGGYGELGNQKIDALQYLALISTGYRYSFGDQPTMGNAQSSIANKNVRWERAKMSNFGLEAGLLQNKLLFTANYFYKLTDQMLVRPPALGSNGSATIPFQNVGKLENRGLELELNYRSNAGALTYAVSGNASFITNKVLQLFNGNFIPSQLYGRSSQEIARTYEDNPIATFYGWRTNGLYQNQQDIDNDPNIANDPRRDQDLIQPGDVRFLDLNGDHVIDDKDRTILGSPHPKMTYGINANLGYKGFDLALFFLGVAGVDIYNADRMQGLDPQASFNMYAETINRWHGEGTSNTIPRMTTKRDNFNHRSSDMFVENGSFFRLKNITLGYTLPAALTQSLRLSKVRFYATGQNVFVITDYSGMDPELGIVQGNLQINVDYAQYPQSRTWILGAQLSF
jgi:TonB-dependent starch-binding outer membrane protein SusC